jgi:integrase
VSFVTRRGTLVGRDAAREAIHRATAEAETPSRGQTAGNCSSSPPSRRINCATGEVVRLKVKHIDSAQNIIRVEQSKSRKDRNVMLSPETLDLLRQWWKTRRRGFDSTTPVAERWLFPGQRPGNPMTTRQLNRLFHEAADAAGIKKGVTLHALRPWPREARDQTALIWRRSASICAPVDVRAP